ncbi:protein argonaute 16-like [Rhodamnia argentea]|uniref:Protein argonaute 16-like n=1 Tax=Rhodamnia argentea TaxID=178133 RepID=A0A8B8QB77_9MYRT|nr:protein argonaute 16-like [Rhodamnia argentea]
MIDALFKPLADGVDDGIMRELLLDFYQSSSGRKPTQIIVFRDGVSESQFNQVLNIKLEQIVKAYRNLGRPIFQNSLLSWRRRITTQLFQT